MKRIKSFYIALTEYIKRTGNRLKRIFKGDFSVFLLFLFMVFLFWFVQKMGKNYAMVMQIPVKVVDVPQNMRMVGIATDKLQITLNGKGYTLWKIGRRRVKPITLSASSYLRGRGRAVLPSHMVRDSIAELLPQGINISSIDPDTLSYQYQLQSLKRMPVAYDGEFLNRNQYVLDSYRFQPDSIDVMVADIANYSEALYVELDSLIVDTDTLLRNLPLRPIDGYYPTIERVTICCYASHYTEKRIQIVVNSINSPEGGELKTFPSRVTLVCWVKLSEYDRISADDFIVVADYNETLTDNTGMVELRILRQPSGVKRIRIVPATVDYLIEQQM